MTDLVERLRLIADDPWPDEWHREAALEALAEIERLRAEVARANTLEEMWRDEALKAQQMLVEAQKKCNNA